MVTTTSGPSAPGTDPVSGRVGRTGPVSGASATETRPTTCVSATGGDSWSGSYPTGVAGAGTTSLTSVRHRGRPVTTGVGSVGGVGGPARHSVRVGVPTGPHSDVGPTPLTASAESVSASADDTRVGGPPDPRVVSDSSTSARHRALGPSAGPRRPPSGVGWVGGRGSEPSTSSTVVRGCPTSTTPTTEGRPGAGSGSGAGDREDTCSPSRVFLRTGAVAFGGDGNGENLELQVGLFRCDPGSASQRGPGPSCMDLGGGSGISTST